MEAQWLIEQQLLIVEKYNNGSLMLSQAFSLLCNAYAVAQTSSFSRWPKSQVFELLGYKFTANDLSGIEIGFEGDIDAWFSNGNRPEGWYKFFNREDAL